MRELALIGAGRVGKAFLRFWNDRDIIVVDPYVTMGLFDHEYAVSDEIKPGMAKVAVVAVPGALAPRIIYKCLDAGMNVIDISFHNGDNESIGKYAEANGCWYIPDCGFGPGIVNMMVRRLAIENAGVHTINAYIGGVPVRQEGPWYYKGTWNTEDHLEEYIRPARFIKDGAQYSVMPLEQDPEFLTVPGVGNMEAFCSDGLRTLLRKPDAPNVTEYTLRWPGFIEKMKLMYDSGLLRPENIGTFANAIEKSEVWKLEEGEQDMSVLDVQAKAHTQFMSGKYMTGMRLIHRRYVHFNHSSMSWCTAVGAGAVLHTVLNNPSSRVGIHYIEDIVSDHKQCGDYIAMLEQGGLEIEEYQ